ncbi:MAG: metal ABC transporter permease [Anaerolineae bacterium]|nr:metal ABC transporter permease [Anaerolineae bacterium]
MAAFWYNLVIAPLEFAFMQRALLAVILVGITSGVMGAFVVTRGMAFLGDALAHSVLPGVAVAFITGNSTQGGLLIGGLVAGILAAIGIGLLTRGQRLREDTAIGIVFAGTLALGIALISTSRTFATDLQHILIGNILSVTAFDLWLMALIGAIVLITTLLLYKELLLVSFDPTLAQALRLPTESLRIVLLVLLAVTVVIGVQAVGVALIAATLVTPAATARFFVKRLHHMMALSAMIASSCGIVAMYLAWHLNIEASAAVVLTMTLVFLLSFLFAPQQGYVWAWRGKA